MLLQFISSIDSDPSGRVKLYWDNLQNTAMTQQFYAKYMSLFTQSNIVNKLQLTDQLAGNNNTFNVDFVLVPFGYEKDSTIVVSDAEIKKYYDSHKKKLYKQELSQLPLEKAFKSLTMLLILQKAILEKNAETILLKAKKVFLCYYIYKKILQTKNKLQTA